jgi:hypothetical protein
MRVLKIALAGNIGQSMLASAGFAAGVEGGAAAESAGSLLDSCGGEAPPPPHAARTKKGKSQARRRFVKCVPHALKGTHSVLRPLAYKRVRMKGSGSRVTQRRQTVRFFSRFKPTSAGGNP